jgi:hypothetical protein
MNERPDLERFTHLPLGLRIEPRPDQASDDPPARTLVFRLRPTRAGEAVLPPVAIAAYDPSLSRYVTRVTEGVPIRAVAVPSFDPAALDDTRVQKSPAEPSLLGWSAVLAATLSLAGFIVWTRRRPHRSGEFSLERARRYARDTTAGDLGASVIGTHWLASDTHSANVGLNCDGHESSLQQSRYAKWGPRTNGTIVITASPEIARMVAQRASQRLATYLRLGTGGACAALTPDEAHRGVALLTSSDDLAAQAGRLIARCDSILYRSLRREPNEDARELFDDARGLFEALGRVTIARHRLDVNEPPENAIASRRS